jgi:FkbM family methyltransferase
MSNLIPYLCEACRPAISRLPAGRVRALHLIGGAQCDGSQWHKMHPHRVFYDPTLRAYVKVDLTDWAGRWHYYTKQYPDPGNQYLILNFLTQGNLYVDVGANSGCHTLLASRVVGTRGHVIAFEPNPDVFRLLDAHLAINNVENVTIHQLGLSDVDAYLSLRNELKHSGTASFRDTRLEEKRTLARARVVRADEFITFSSEDRVLVKIDVEGYEFKVIKGFGELLSHSNMALSVEITDVWLRETGSSAKEVFDYLARMDFGAFCFRRRRLGRVSLETLFEPPAQQQDVVFAKPGFFES